jgi:quercetin dioxygenase-like cupin family protein
MMLRFGRMRYMSCGRYWDFECEPQEVKVPIAAIPTVQTETDEVRVTQWRLPAGSATGHHRHEFDYVVVPMTDGRLTLVTADGRGEGAAHGRAGVLPQGGCRA